MVFWGTWVRIFKGAASVPVCEAVGDSGIYSQERVTRARKTWEENTGLLGGQQSLGAYGRAKNRESPPQLFGSQNVQKLWKKDEDFCVEGPVRKNQTGVVPILSLGLQPSELG